MPNDLLSTWGPLLIGLIGTLIGASPMLIKAIVDRRKTHVEGDSVLVQTALSLLPAQGDVIESLTKQLKDCEGDQAHFQMADERKGAIILGLRVGIARLIQQLHDNRLEPVWKPTAKDFGDQ